MPKWLPHIDTPFGAVFRSRLARTALCPAAVAPRPQLRKLRTKSDPINHAGWQLDCALKQAGGVPQMREAGLVTQQDAAETGRRPQATRPHGPIIELLGWLQRISTRLGRERELEPYGLDIKVAASMHLSAPRTVATPA